MRGKGQTMSCKRTTVLLVTLALVISACAANPPRLDLVTVPPCPAEDGPGMSGPVPCVFHVDRVSDTANGHGAPGSTVRWYLYADRCPVSTVQDFRLVECVDRADWAGEHGSGEGRTN